MFVRNFSSIPSNLIVLVDADAKKYLESIGFCVLSINNGKFAFTKSKDLLNKLLLWEGGKTDGQETNLLFN